MNKVHTRINWENYPSGATPINETNLNAMDASIDEIDDRVVTMDASKATKTEVATTITNVSFDESTGVFTFTRKNGTTFTLNTLLEKIATNFEYDYSTQTLILTLVDGTTQTIDLSALLTQYEFTDSGTINFEIDSSGKVTATIINGSITDAMLESGYLSKVTTQANTAKTNATKAQSYAVGGTSSRDGEDTDNSKHYYTKSKEMFDTLVGAGDIPTVTTTDTTLTNSKASIAKINAIRGNSEQNSYSGKNLYDNVKNNNSTTQSGVTLTKAEDGLLSISGTATADVNITMKEFTLSAGDYYFNNAGTVSSSVAVGLYDKTNSKFLVYNTTGGGAFTLTEDTTLYIALQVFTGKTASGTFKFQIEKGSEFTGFEPYVGNMASPNPEYPQDIRSSGDGGSIKVTSHGKNHVYETFEKYNIFADGKFASEANYSIHIAKVVSGETYTITTNDEAGFVGGYYKDKPTISSVTYDQTRAINYLSKRITIPDGVSYVAFRSMYGYATPQLELGDTATDYEPYIESTFDIPLSEPLRSVKDKHDEIVKQNGVWGMLRAIKNDVFDGSEGWEYFANNTSVNQFHIANITSIVARKSVNCTHFIGISIADREYNYETIYLATSGICVNTKIATTVDEWKTWLATNPITVNYELATPIFEPFADEYQSLFYELESYDGITYITTDSEVQPTIEVEYAVTDAGAHLLNNYAKSNLAELKAEEATKIKESTDVVVNTSFTNTYETSLNKVGNIAMFSASVTLGRAGTGGMTLFTLPDGYKPIAKVYGALNLSESNPAYNYIIYTDGSIAIDGVLPLGTYTMTATYICS